MGIIQHSDRKNPIPGLPDRRYKKKQANLNPPSIFFNIVILQKSLLKVLNNSLKMFLNTLIH